MTTRITCRHRPSAANMSGARIRGHHDTRYSGIYDVFNACGGSDIVTAGEMAAISIRVDQRTQTFVGYLGCVIYLWLLLRDMPHRMF